VPSGTQAQDDKAYVDQYYGNAVRFGEVLVRYGLDWLVTPSIIQHILNKRTLHHHFAVG
jgi:hypothetical protein